MKGVGILGEAPGEIRGGSASGVATVAGANLPPVHEKIGSPVEIASEHQGGKAARPTMATELNKLHLPVGRPSDR
jgi:hypothetical protein